MITIGNSNLSNIKYGNQNITAVYAGDTLIWPSNDDPVSVIIGGGYRLPTIGEWNELISKSTITVEWDSYIEEYVALLRTPTGRILPIPLGDGDFPQYMSSNRSDNIEQNYSTTYYLGNHTNPTQSFITNYSSMRYVGQYIRPVCERGGKPAEISQAVTLINDPELSVLWCYGNLSNDANNPVNATTLSESGKFAWGETLQKTSFELENYKFYDNNQNIYTRYNNNDNLTILRNNVKR